MKLKFTLLAFLVSTSTFAQDLPAAKKMIDTLTSSYFWGRGYTKNGVVNAAKFLENEFKAYGLKTLSGNSYLQNFSYPVNIFPGKMEVSINHVKLVPGVDFIVTPDSKGIIAEGKLVMKDSTHFIDTVNRILVSLENKLTWSVSVKEADYTSIQIDKQAVKQVPLSINADIENKFLPNFISSNVCGIVRGTAKPDSFIVISAHYDHLGGMGAQTYFPGANDNASGTTLLLSLAKYYAANPQPYSMIFICFSGEEAGLIGSKYFTENPLVDLKKIKFLLNTDLAGTGIEGITVVNATQFPKEFALLNKVNDENKYLVKINSRGKAANSDHYWFTEKGVPAFFIYTLGGIKAYHDVFDKSSTLPLTEFEDLYRLIIKFNTRLMAPN